jgi:predicted MFS family arabinose efflux permease
MRPVQGRLIDRVGQHRTLLVAATLNTLALIGLVVGAELQVGRIGMVLLAAAGGLSLPALSACLRVLWRTLTPDGDERTTAFALDSLLYETALIGSPLLVGLLVYAASPAAALLVLAALSLAGTLAVATSAPARAATGERHATPGARALNAGLVALVGLAVSVGIVQGSLALLVPAFATRHGTPAASGPLLAALSIGSIAGGLLYGARSWRSAAPRRLLVLLAWLSAGLAALAAADAWLAFAPLLALAGLALGPTITTIFLVADRIAAVHAMTESFAWLSFATPAGAAAGNALAGVLVARAGLHPAIWLPAAAAALSTGLALAAHRRLSAPGLVLPRTR